MTDIFAGWSSFALAYTGLAYVAFASANSDELHQWLDQTTPRKRSSRFWLWLSGGSGASTARDGSSAAVLAVLALAFVPEFRASTTFIIVSIVTVGVAWLLNVFAHAVQYARQQVEEPGLTFPGETPPSFIDYLFLSVQVSTAFMPSDVVVTTTQLRRTMMGHSIIAFAFNTIIITILVSGIISAAQ